MNELVRGLMAIVSDCMSIFSKDPRTGRLSFSFVDSFFYFMLPILIFIGTFYFNIPIGDNLNKAIVGVLTIFVVLSFQIIYIANDKFVSKVKYIMDGKKEKDNGRKELYDDEKNYLKRIGNYTLQFVRQMVLLILISILIILSSLLLICTGSHSISMIFSAIMLSLFYLWILLLLKMVVSIYNLQVDEIRQHNRLIR